MRRASMRDVFAEGALLAGGGTAILLQIADPTIAAGVARHSDFATQPLQRLRGTLTFVYTVVFGSDEDLRSVREAVNRVHQPVAGAFDPGLQLWVAATLYKVGSELDERIWGPLDPASAERVYRESAVLGTALQMPQQLWPENLAAFTAYWNGRLAELDVTPAARRVALDLLHPRSGPWWLTAAMPLGRLLTVGLLPPAVRAAYGLPWDATRERRFRRALGALSAVYRRLPRRLRNWPSRYFASQAVPSVAMRATAMNPT